MVATFLFDSARAADTVRLEPTPYELPTRIGPLVYDGPPHRFAQKELGVGYHYTAPGMMLHFYLYDGGLENIGDGAEAPAVCEEFEATKAGLLSDPSYENAVLEVEQFALLEPPRKELLAREAVLEFEMNDRPVVSYLWMTGGAGNFVKIRFTLDATLRAESTEARRAVLSALGTAIKPHQKAAVPDAQATDDGVAIVINSAADADTDDMAFGFIYLGALSAVSEKLPSQAPTCAGEFVPGYPVELGAFQTAIAFSGDGKVAKRLQKVASAGFIEEFVWVYRHRAGWGMSPPEGLDLIGFEPWAQKNLKRFEVPNFGYLEVRKGRALPIEAWP